MKLNWQLFAGLATGLALGLLLSTRYHTETVVTSLISDPDIKVLYIVRCDTFTGRCWTSKAAGGAVPMGWNKIQE